MASAVTANCTKKFVKTKAVESDPDFLAREVIEVACDAQGNAPPRAPTRCLCQSRPGSRSCGDALSFPPLGGICRKTALQDAAEGLKIFAICEGTVTSDVVAWGLPGAGGDTSNVEVQLSSLETIFAFPNAFVALRSDGRIVSWGNEEVDMRAVESQLWSVEEVYALQDHEDASDDQPQFAFAAKRTDRTLITWGGPQSGSDSHSVRAVREFLIDVDAVCSTSGAFAVMTHDGKVIVWGHSDYGGDATEVWAQLVSVATIYATERAFAARRANGSLVAWGEVNYGGDTSAVDAHLYCRSQFFYSNRGNVASLNAGCL